VIDKLDLRVSEFALPGPILAGPLGELKRHPVPLFRPSKYYQYVCDLREPFAIDAVLHFSLRLGRPSHKIEIIDAGEKSLLEIAGITSQLFDVDPWTLQVMRIDLAADVEGVSVPWFKNYASADRKQFSSRIDKSLEKELQFIGMGSAAAQTLYFGKRPNLIRIYNKLAEWRMQLRKIENRYRRFNDRMMGLEMSEEQEYFGRLIAPTLAEYCRQRDYQLREDSVLTRIERQMGGNRIPPELATLGDLRQAHRFHPFSGIHIASTEPVQNIASPPPGIPINNWFASIGYEAVKEQLGSEQLARSFVLKHGNGNGKRILEALEKASPSKRVPITMAEIQESFSRSTLLQTSSSNRGGVHLSPTYDDTKQIARSRVGILS
jgi:hypothetical protein